MTDFWTDTHSRGSRLYLSGDLCRLVVEYRRALLSSMATSRGALQGHVARTWTPQDYLHHAVSVAIEHNHRGDRP